MTQDNSHQPRISKPGDGPPKDSDIAFMATATAEK